MDEDLLPGDMVCNHPKNAYAVIKRSAVPEDRRRADDPCYDFKDKVALVLGITELASNGWATAQRVCLLLHADGTYGWECEQRLQRVDP